MKKPNQPAAGVIRSLFLLLCALCFAQTVKAQSGLNCTDAITLPDDFQHIAQTGSELWITFTTGDSAISETAFGVRGNNTSEGYLDTLEIYSGDCSSLNLESRKTRLPGDSSIIDTINVLQPNTVYYIRTVRNCTLCDDTLFFEFASRSVAGGRGYTLDPQGSNPQTYICGSFFNDCHITICRFGTVNFFMAGLLPSDFNRPVRWRRNNTTLVNCQLQFSVAQTFNNVGTFTISFSQMVCNPIGVNSGNFIVHVVNPLIVGVTPPTSNICPGQSVTLTAANIPSGQSVLWSNGQNGVTSITVSPAVTTTYTANIITCPTTSATVNVLQSATANAGNDVSICNGQSVTLTGTSNLSGSNNWSVVNGAPLCLGCNATTVSPTVTTAYVFSAQNPNTGCFGRDTVTVTVLPSPSVNAGNNVNVCLGQSLTLTGTVTGTYDQISWSSNLTSLCVGCSTISFTPALGTQYAVFTATNSTSGCTVTDTVLINITQLPGVAILPVLGANANILCADVAYTVTGAPAGAQYFWGHTSTPTVPGAVTGVGQYTVNWTAANVTAGNITCTVIAPDGCTAILSLPVTTTCCTSTGSETPIILNNASSANLISAMQLICPSCVSGNTVTCPPSTPVHINGTFTVNQPLVLINFIDLRMGTNATVNILAGNALELRNCTTSLYCPYMWEGIYINGTTATLKTNTNTLLQQARNAVVSVSGGVFAVDNTTFRNCVKGIVVQTYTTAAHTGTVKSSVFDMPGSFLPAVPALPASTTKTLAGIEINWVNNITIGDASQANFKNTFTGLFKGVYALASGTTVRNADFTNIVASTSVTMSGTAIHCEGQKNVPYTQFINAGGTAANQPCRFDNIRRGVVVSLAHNVNVTGNSFTNFTNWIFAPAVGISVTNCLGRTVNIANNRISNFSTANRLPNGITVTDVGGSTVTISNNRLLQCSSTASSYAEQTGTGITVQNTTPVSVNLNILNNDTLSRFAYGITLTNISNTNQALVKNNRILFAKPKANYSSQLHYGIGLINCTQVKADSNRVQRTTTGVWQSSDAATLATNLRGVYVTNSSGCMVSQNTFTGLGEGVHANSTCPATFFVCNSFNQSYRACMFSGANTNNAAYLNDQLNFQSTIYPTGNVFTGSATSDLAGAIRLVTNTNNPINWYYSGIIPSVGLIPGSLAGAGNSPTPTNNQSPCNLPPFLMAQGGDQREMLAGSQISVSEDVQTTDMNKEMAAKEAHLLLLQNPDWLNLNTPEDADYQQFYAATDTTEIGKTNHTELAAFVDDTVQAVQLNYALAGTTDLTETHKTVFEIYNRSWLLDNTAFSAADTAVLLAIALQHPADGGEAVYTARVMLGITVDDATGNYSYRLAEPESIPVIAADVFPNPAATQVTVKGNFNEADVLTFTLVDLTGRVVTNQQLPAGNSTINVDLSTLQNGAYLYQITVNGAMVQSERLVIAR